MVDQTALRTNQVFIVLFVALAFVLGADRGGPWIVLFIAIAMGIGWLFPGKGPFQLFYRHVLAGRALVKPRIEPGSAAPHRFAQAMGSAVLMISAVLLFAGFETAGWALALIVLSLALVNLLFNFCTGCFIYLHLNRLRHRTRGVA